MKLLIAVEQGKVSYCLLDGRRVVERGVCQGVKAAKDQVLGLRKKSEIDVIGYRVIGGGPRFSQTVMERTAGLVASLGETFPGPAGDDLIVRELADFFWERFIECRHFLLSETAFLARLPEPARSFAIPIEYTERGLRKYGRAGILQAWAMRKMATRGLRPERVIVIVLGEKTAIAAFRDGLPLAVSSGFSDFDGVMSQTGCGDIDTSIVFQMFSAGVSTAHIRSVLSENSGFRALVGECCELPDVLGRDDAEARWAREIFSYQVLKYIGAYTAVLQGIPTLAFLGSSRAELHAWAVDLLSQLDFMGFHRAEGPVDAQPSLLVTPDSPAKAYYFECDLWQAMAELVDERM